MNHRTWIVGACGLTVLSIIPPAHAREDRPEAAARLIAPADLQARIGKPGVLVLDTRSRADYLEGHLPESVPVDVKAAEELAARPGGLTDRAAWSAWIRPLGISPEVREIWIIDGKKQIDAARTWWLLTYLGVDHVGLVDGNYKLWTEEKRPTTNAAPIVVPREFPIQFRRDRLATAEDVLGALKDHSARIIDARSLAEHTGDKAMAKRGGRVPTSCHLEWSDLVDADGRFLAKSQVKQRLDTLGIKPGEAVITHCQGGGRAAVDTFALERLGLPARNYYLGWSDWGNRAETPVEKDAKKP